MYKGDIQITFNRIKQSIFMIAKKINKTRPKKKIICMIDTVGLIYPIQSFQ